MFELLQLSLVAFSTFSAGAVDKLDGMVISTTPESFATAVFEGPDAAMPLGKGFIMAVDIDPKAVAPDTFDSGLTMLRSALPHWYLQALNASGEPLECTVHVNGVPYSTFVKNWLWVRWQLDDSTSLLRQTFESAGHTDREAIQQAVHDALCIDLRQGRSKALDFLNRSEQQGR